MSVVINNYNYGRFLAQAIRSALAQTYAHCEVIVIDDGSTDDSLAVASKFGDAIRVVAKPNGGQASAFNRGFAEARGEWILFLDADDELYPEAIERVVPLMEPGVCKIHFPLQVVHEKGDREESGGLWPSTPLSQGNVVPQIVKGSGYSWPPTSGNVFARRCLARMLPMEEEDFRICADVYLCLKIIPLGEIRAVAEPLAKYRIHGANSYSRFSLESGDLRRRAAAHLQLDKLLTEVAGAEMRGRTWSTRGAFEVALLARRFGCLGSGWDDLPGYTELYSMRKARLSGQDRSVYHRAMEQMTWGILRYGPKFIASWWLTLREQKAKAAHA